MNTIIAIAILMLLIGLISKTERQYTILWSFATPIFYIIFGFKSLYINLGFTEVELFSGVLPMVVCIMVWQKLSATERRRAWKYSPKFWWLFLAYYFASLFWTNNLATGVRTVLEIAFPSFLYLVAFNVIQNDLHLEKYLKWMIAINLVVAVFDLYNAYNGWTMIERAGAMSEGVIGYRTVTAYFYVTMSTILLMRLMDAFEWRLLAVFAIDVFLMLIAGSRTPTFTFIAGALVAIIYRRSLKFAVIGIVVLAMLVGTLFLLPTRNKFLNSDESLNMRDSGRAFFQKYFEDKAEEGPLWGYGAGGTEKYAQWLTEHVTMVGAPHNEYLRIRFDGGIIGLALFYLGLADILVRGLWWGRGVKAYFPYRAILVMTPIMFAVSCTNDNTFFYFYVFTQYLFVFMGFGARLCYEDRVLRGLETMVLSPDEVETLKEQMGELQPAT
ncbi:MAG: O-antigen ligase family protein [Bacteroidota bacterium]|nr:O-antigen ligase family protein [Bacteroidota bacterium]MDP4232705.1 O-antigen ligase family protein [Bacteroidota bacterium]MDP4243162.1 O-antigen ligase family protein [Bacteroidota bacterium]MDP4287619.1 O-antigen ligase family protein [Bacteroidota bacterium]